MNELFGVITDMWGFLNKLVNIAVGLQVIVEIGIMMDL